MIVCPLGMPKMDGYAFVRQPRSGPDPGPRIPAAALTAFARSGDWTRALFAGFQMHLAKSIDSTS